MGGDPGRRRSRSRPPRDAIRGDRERKIRGIVAQQPVGTQEEMAAALRRQGLAVTQATVSRDWYIIKGGSFSPDQELFWRCFMRRGWPKNLRRSKRIGFRCVRDAKSN